MGVSKRLPNRLPETSFDVGALLTVGSATESLVGAAGDVTGADVGLGAGGGELGLRLNKPKIQVTMPITANIIDIKPDQSFINNGVPDDAAPGAEF